MADRRGLVTNNSGDPALLYSEDASILHIRGQGQMVLAVILETCKHMGYELIPREPYQADSMPIQTTGIKGYNVFVSSKTSLEQPSPGEEAIGMIEVAEIGDSRVLVIVSLSGWNGKSTTPHSRQLLLTLSNVIFTDLKASRQAPRFPLE